MLRITNIFVLAADFFFLSTLYQQPKFLFSTENKDLNDFWSSLPSVNGGKY